MSEISPIEALANEVLRVNAELERKEGALRATPWWRVRRRRRLVKSVQRRREWEQAVRDGLLSTAYRPD